ncbi:Ig-like domain-containing protein, partial [Bifidobacterium boum]|uniref:Ig-like domain-containing protein n=1 Tax=Bifidobacterium boum TaxID=78343 RepID=UPI003F91D12E
MPDVAVSSVVVSGSGVSNGALSLAKGKSVQLSASVNPSNATSRTVTWSSSNAAVASVTGTGYVSAVKAGTATITATAGGKSASVKVTVADASVSSGSGDSLAVRRGNMYYVRNSLSGGSPDLKVEYGLSSDQVLVGDWDGDGKDTLMVRRGN